MTTIKPGIISEEASEWDQMTLDRKLALIAKILDNTASEPVSRMTFSDLDFAVERLEELSTHVFKHMRDTGETI